MPGPPPNPHAVRRNARVGMVNLPASGRKGRTPKWPLPDSPRLTGRIAVENELIEQLEDRELDDGGLSRTDATKLTRARQRLAMLEEEVRVTRDAELEVWRELWKTPQACEWERLRWTRDVAQYVRHKVAGECGNLEESKEARLRGHQLGLTPSGLRSLMWVIAADEIQERREAKKADETATQRRRMIRAVDTTGS